MISIRQSTAGAALALSLALSAAWQPGAAYAQAPTSEWFVPSQQQPRPVPGAPRPAPARAPASTGAPAQPSPPNFAADGTEEPSGPPQQVQVQLPPMPEIPVLPKGPATPAAIIGILSVPDVLRISTAYQQGDKELGARRQKLNEDAQKEQAALRDLGQALANDRGKMSPEQIRAKERELQDRIADSRRKFGERNRVIQEAGQYVMAEIDRVLEQVAQAVATSRGVNLVLNRAQILGTTADFDLTPQVAEVLNKVLPTVLIPPDGVSPTAMAVPQAPVVAPTATAASSGLTTSGIAASGLVPVAGSTASGGSAAGVTAASAPPTPPAPSSKKR